MDSIMQLFLRFSKGSYSFRYKVLSLLPGTLVFLAMTPFVVFIVSRFLASFIAVSCSRNVELGIAFAALSFALLFMNWSLLSLWIDGEGTPAPIAPTKKLVTTGPYGLCRNPIELGTSAYFLFFGIWFDGLLTGILCMAQGLLLGYGYIKLIEERELMLRFGEQYEAYKENTPLLVPSLFRRGRMHD